jgi:hypothetical protein
MTTPEDPVPRDAEVRCPCCGQQASAQIIEIARQDRTGPAEDPEQAYRRGYCQGALVAVDALQDHIADSTLVQKIWEFLYQISDWRGAWRHDQNQKPRRWQTAPEPYWMKERRGEEPTTLPSATVPAENPKRSTPTSVSGQSESVRDGIRPLAPYWLPRQQRQHLDRIFNKLIERGTCSICGGAHQSNSHTAYGLDRNGKVAAAGKCCIDKITTLMGYGFFGRCDFPDSSPDSLHEHVRALSAREWKLDDRAWFGKNPARSHRARMPFGSDRYTYVSMPFSKDRPECTPLVLVRQTKPGTWLRLGFDLSADMVPPPDDEALIHAMFEIAAGREPPPTTMQAIMALRNKYAVRSSC